MSAALRNMPAFFRASVFSCPAGIRRAASRASIALASQSMASVEGCIRFIRGALLRSLYGVSVKPRLVLEKPPQGYRDLQVWISLRPGRYRTGETEHCAAQFNKLRHGVAGFFDRSAIGRGHDAHPSDQAGAEQHSQSPMVADGGAVMEPKCSSGSRIRWSIQLTFQ